MNDAWEEAKQYAPAVRYFVSGGGSYLGFCLGAYLAGSDPGFDLVPDGDEALFEAKQSGSAVKNVNNTVIEVD